MAGYYYIRMLLFYTHTITPRLQYIVDFISTELFDTGITITTDAAAFTSFAGPRFNYSAGDFSDHVDPCPNAHQAVHPPPALDGAFAGAVGGVIIWRAAVGIVILSRGFTSSGARF